jgi:hypothetical protein
VLLLETIRGNIMSDTINDNWKYLRIKLVSGPTGGWVAIIDTGNGPACWNQAGVEAALRHKAALGLDIPAALHTAQADLTDRSNAKFYDEEE